MKTFLTMIMITTFIFSGTRLFSQAPQKQWDVDFGGDQNDFLNSMQQTSDGGFIFGGYSESGISGDKTQDNRGSSDYWVVKTDANGLKQWDARFGGSSVDQMTALQQTADGGYILGGISFSGISGDKTQASQGQSDYWIVKTDANGVKQWDARFGGVGRDELHALQQTADGGYILGGYSFSGRGGDQSNAGKGAEDYWIVKTDANGIKQWDARFGGNKTDEINALQQTSDGGYILGGYSVSGITGDKTQANKGGTDYWIVKTDVNGVKQWDLSLGGNDDDWLTSLKQTTDGGYIFGGWSWSQVSGDKSQPTQGDNDYWMVKTDANGLKQFDADFGGNSNDYLGAIQQTADGGYALGGYSSSPISGDKTQAGMGGTDYWMVKTNTSGVKEWDLQFGGADFDFLTSMQQTADGGYALGGYSASNAGGDKTQVSRGLNDYWVVKTEGTTATCNVPANPVSAGVTTNSIKLKWDAVSGAQSYKVSYKEATAAEWITIKSNSNQKKLEGLLPGTTYDWRVRTVCSKNPNLLSPWSATQSFTTLSLRLEGFDENTFTVYPNPVSSSATVSFLLPEDAPVKVVIKDISGRTVKILDDENDTKGNHEITFNRKSLVTGIYFLQLKTSEDTRIVKFVIE